MTLREYATKHVRLAGKHGTAAALSSATTEAVAKLALRPYIRYRQAWVRREIHAQHALLDELRGRDQWTLLVFDAGRYDYLAPLLRDTFAGTVRPTYSAARDTFEWASTTWRGDFEDVTYVTGMVPVSDEINESDTYDFRRLYGGVNPGDSIGKIRKVWETHWDDRVGTVPPEAVTDVALEYADRDKLVVHYAQPHSPYIGTPELLGYTDELSAQPDAGRPNDEPIWEAVRAGDVTDLELRLAYWGNAARAINAARPLVQEREIVVATADHGEALGEYGMYTHDRAPHPKRRVVPWQRITGLAPTQRTGRNAVDPTDKLEALGYL